ncbi:FG-GAP repeat protein OS=Singulisphaera acidiphila (strain ATCC BAA-1392 / DSM 18658 / VKM B-2454 / MOB10) GN=Sinac_0686 PE=4 SV=1: VCBS: FG-GAP [Gemmataceae bacterium]|nr:FG-GAP repeat protein OS=Singulisphaera acidiphila (strain ATCC BAA-1392 / DSM 18658 / VKM B-2454 / MOB10) GN=Sinac_0686 PE=4 SV=1: VCBS: FG-GAP [Gemmataceae bacterium]VTT99665.1 FG-GAP repeat protein OS=Singulisphaera acidiphila (strain ATCC BAA-1392 / DSM 18658 / VKM B-2454 / MOB10) GN=Sinac_0686 PE=4 SV=1: VCBS: FG-GAP [Gemmataceae bacterium]
MRHLLSALLAALPVAAHAAELPKFKPQEIDSGLKIGYAVLAADVDGDKKLDLVVVDQHKLVWYQNPGKPGGDWKKRVILDGKTKPDNVCAAAIDIDGDGLPEFVIGSAWKPFDTANAAQHGWVKRGKSLDDEWAYHPLPCDEPTVHRVRVFDIDGDGKPEIVHVPLMGRDATAKGNWTDGRPVRIVALKVPANEPEKKENWKTEVLSDSLNVTHNFWPVFEKPGTAPQILVTSYDGVHVVKRDGEKWSTTKIGEGNQANPKGTRGASEIKYTKFRTGERVIATIEPWHGNQVVVYTPPKGAGKLWDRHVVDEQLRWGHAVWFADLDGDGTDELVIGVRDDPNPKAGDKHTERRGVRVYKATDGKGEKWERTIIEDGGVAVEDLTVADLDGDGKQDIIAVGRATGNARIYWNQGK